ncbi:MAG: cytochrome c biogenesis protein CcsA [candidate division WOR-3 bacterium]
MIIKKFLRIFISPKTSFLLVFFLILSVIIGTLIDRNYGKSTAEVLVYNSKWFTILWSFFAITLLTNLIYFRLWKKKAIFFFHLAILIILLGYGVTRFSSVEGFLHLREGEGGNEFFSPHPYLWIKVSDDNFSMNKECPIYDILGEGWERKIDAGDYPIYLKIENYIPNARKAIVEDSTGEPLLEIVVFTPHFSTSWILEKGEKDSLFGINFGFEAQFKGKDPFINFEEKKERICFFANRPIKMEDKAGQRYNPFIYVELESLKIYTIDTVSFMLTKYQPKGRIKAIPMEIFEENLKRIEAINVIVKKGIFHSSFSLFLEDKDKSNSKVFDFNGLKMNLKFGQKSFFLPFTLRLVDFKIKRYEGREEPSQFQSELVIEEPYLKKGKYYSIWLNHPLFYRGYHVYQHSFDKDEKGSTFFVVKDPGTPIAYFGFFLLIVTMIFIAFSPKGRIRELKRGLENSFLSFLFLNFCFNLSSWNVKIENFYYRINIFEKLGEYFLVIIGLFLLMNLFLRILKVRFKKTFSFVDKFLNFGIFVGFLGLSFGLAIRWFLSGYPPLSNKYETMIFVSWAILLAGILLSFNSRLPILFGGTFSGVLLILAHLSSSYKINPLSPILKSKWLIFHVGIAITSYGFFFIGTGMAIFTLLVLGLSISKRENQLLFKTLKWSKIIEQALWIGLFLIILGTIFGAIWANESWGKYWDWDPKEAWTLVVILSYTLLLHLRVIFPSNWRYWLIVSSILCFGNLLMTYFGVNLFYSGKHSYINGGFTKFPIGIILFLGIWFLLSILAYRNKDILNPEGKSRF